MWTKEKRREYNKKYYQENRERIVAYQKNWQKEHKKEVRDYYLEHKERINATKRAWRRANKDKVRLYRLRRKSREKEEDDAYLAEAKRIQEEQIKKMYEAR